ncbi:hypothetical protein A6J63_025070 [Yersinia enterocolitica]|nr:hypothetical protein A6J63_025070 [Yersinia enterocolitica]
MSSSNFDQYWRCYASGSSTSKFQLALADAPIFSSWRDNQFIEPLHLMSALLNQDGGTVRHC